MAPSKVTIQYAKPGTQPPIYLAGSFSNPGWVPFPMEYTTDDHNEHIFRKEVDVEEGQSYQYKFRIGEGDWWTLNEDSPIATDNIGNRNNKLDVPIPNTPKALDTETAPTPVTTKSNSDQSEFVPVAPREKMAVPETHDAFGGDGSVSERALPIRETETIVEGEKSADVKENLSLESPPALVVHKIDDSPNHGDDFGKAATSAQRVAHAARSEDAEPDYVIVKSGPTTPETSAAQANPASEAAEVAAEVSDSSASLDQEINTPEMSDEEAGRIGYRRMSATPINEVADTAAEVSNSAAELDREVPTPEISDEDAGRIGLRRLSTTPIPEIADTAAEVADVAAKLDSEEQEPISEEGPHIIAKDGSDSKLNDDDDYMSAKHLAKHGPRSFSHECLLPPTAEETKAYQAKQKTGSREVVESDEDDDYISPTHLAKHGPRSFSHECQLPPTAEETKAYKAAQKKALREAESSGPWKDFDPNDPTLEPFPTDREGILEQIRLSSLRYKEDVINDDPVSPSLGSDRPAQPVPSPNLLARSNERSTSLGSIAEDEKEEETAPLPAASISPTSALHSEVTSSGLQNDVRRTSVDVREVLESPPPESPEEPDHVKPTVIKLPETSFVQNDSQKLGVEETSPERTQTSKSSPGIVVSPATPDWGSTLASIPDLTTVPVDTVKVSAIEAENGRGGLRSRKEKSGSPERRPITPTSIRSAHDPKSGSFLQAFLKLLFVDWIGGFLLKLCGGDRRKLMAVIAVLVLAPTFYILV